MTFPGFLFTFKLLRVLYEFILEDLNHICVYFKLFLSEGDKRCANNDITRKRSDDKRFLQYDHLKIKRWLVAFLKSYTTEKYAKRYILTFDPQ